MTTLLYNKTLNLHSWFI